MKPTIITAIQALIPNVSIAMSSDVTYDTGWDFPHAKSVFTDSDNNPVVICWEQYTVAPLTQEQVNAEINRLQSEYDNTEYQRLRALEYPDMYLYLDAVVKGDLVQQQLYIDQCLAVKAKYPKPTGVV